MLNDGGLKKHSTKNQQTEIRACNSTSYKIIENISTLIYYCNRFLCKRMSIAISQLAFISPQLATNFSIQADLILSKNKKIESSINNKKLPVAPRLTLILS